MKRIGILVAIVVVSLGGLLIISPLVRNASIQENAALGVIPPDALLIARINQWRNLREQQRESDTLWALLRASDPGRLLQQLAVAMDSLRVEDSELFNTVVAGESCVSWHLMGKKALSPLLVLQMSTNNSNPEQLFAALMPKAVPIASQVYAGTKITSFTLDEKTNQQAWHAATKANLCFFSTSRVLLENALRMQTAEHSLLQEPDFVRTLESSSRNAPWNVFIQLPSYVPYVAPLLNGLWQRLVAEAARWTTWVGLDIVRDGNALTLQGLSLLQKERKLTSNRYADAKHSQLMAPNILPVTVPVFFRWGDRNPEQLYAQLSGVASQNLQKKTPLLVQAEIQELTLAWDEQNGAGTWVVILAPRSTSHALGIFRSELSDKSVHETLQRLQLDKDTELIICPSAHPEYFLQHFGTLFPKDVGRFYAIVDRYIVFANSPQVIERLALAKRRAATLSETKQWKEMSEQLQSQCNFMFYSSPYQRRDFSGLFFSQKSHLQKGHTAQLANSLAGIAIQISGAGKILFYNAFFQQSKSQYSAMKSDAQTSWDLLLEAPMLGRPIFVTNHNTHEQEVLVQDESGKLYLVNKLGRILWRAQLEGQICGEPKQVDLFRNEKLQYVFCTRNKLYAVDRNGNMVEGFPVRLPAETYAPLAVFDYEGKRDYRFVVTCANRHSYMYDRMGKLVTGFRPPQTETATTHPLVWFTSRGKDYIVVCDSNRMYFLDRRGEERLRTQSSVARASGAPLGVEFGTDPKVLTVDREGALCAVRMVDGTVTRNRLPAWGNSSKGVWIDLDKDGKLDIVYTHGKELIAADREGRELFRQEFDAQLGEWLHVFRFAGDEIRLGVYAPSAQRVWLLTQTGEIVKGYPLEGASPFSIGSFMRSPSVFKLVTGEERILHCYELPKKE